MIKGKIIKRKISYNTNNFKNRNKLKKNNIIKKKKKKKISKLINSNLSRVIIIVL